MKLNPEHHGKGRDDESKGRQSSFARARSQLTQAVGDVLSGPSKKAGGWLNAFAAPASASTPHADRLREVVIRDRALFAANPRPRRTLREEEDDEAASAAATQADTDDDLTIVAASPLAEAAKAAAEAMAAERETAAGSAHVDTQPVAAEPEPEATPVAQATDDRAVQALAAAIDAAAREERVPEDQEEAAPAPQPAARDAATAADPEVASAPAAAEATPLEQLAAKATKTKNKPGAREGGRPPKREPIRTRTMARLLASQGHRTRALSIYDELLAKDTSDVSLREEAEAVRNQAE